MERPLLTEQEWDLALELLEREWRELVVEIRHTTTREMRDRLKEKLQLVEGLLAKVTQATARPAAAAL